MLSLAKKSERKRHHLKYTAVFGYKCTIFFFKRIFFHSFTCAAIKSLLFFFLSDVLSIVFVPHKINGVCASSKFDAMHKINDCVMTANLMRFCCFCEIIIIHVIGKILSVYNDIEWISSSLRYLYQSIPFTRCFGEFWNEISYFQ